MAFDTLDSPSLSQTQHTVNIEREGGGGVKWTMKEEGKGGRDGREDKDYNKS